MRAQFRAGASFAAGSLVLLLTAPAASAHGLSGRADLPIPTWLFTWGAAIVLAVSFAALAALWPRPRLQDPAWRPLRERLGRLLTAPLVEGLCGAIGVGLMALTVWSGFAGSDVISDNFAPTFVYVGFWLGLVPLSVLFGDVFRAFNPWRAVGRAVGGLLGGRAPEPLPYPERLGRWPAVVGLLGFAYLELGASSGDRPDTIATTVVVYSAVTWFAMALYGTEAWTARGEAFSGYYGLLARIAPFERRGRRIGRRPLLSGLPRLDPAPGTVALVAAMIGTVTFDGLSAGETWQRDVLDPALDALDGLGLGPRASLELTYAAGILVAVALVLGFYRLGIAGARTVDRRRSAAELAAAYAHSLVPIAFAYAAAHYVSLLIFQGQALPALASDPLGRGWDLFGTADWTVDYGVVGAEAFWYIQVGLVVLGHVGGLVLAHDRALVLYDDVRAATRSQYWMLAVMVGFTTLALWLLSEASEG